MAVLDLSLVRGRLAARPLSAVLAAGALAWMTFLMAIFARDAYRVARAHGLVDGFDLAPELQVLLAGGAIPVLAGILAYVFKPATLGALRRLSVAAALVAAAVFTVTSHQESEVIAFVAIVVWSWVVGGPLLALIDEGATMFSGAVRLALEVGLGLAVLSFAMLALALAGALGDAGIISVFVLGTLGAVGARFRSAEPATKVADGSSEEDWALLEYAALVLVSVTLVLSFAASLAPQLQFDALHYHFAVPRIFLAEGRFVERPDIMQSYLPLGLEMTYVPALRFGGETSMTLLNWVMAPLLIALVWGGADRAFGRPAGALAGSLIGLAALVTYEASSASSDLAMAVWLVAAALALSAYARHPSGRAAACAGLFGGLALTFKIVAGIYLVPLALAFAALAVLTEGAGRRALRNGSLFVAGGVLTGAPWLLLRLFQTGNPVFPFYNNIFRSDKWPPVNERFDLWLFGIGHSATDALSVWWQIAVHPWRFGQWLAPWSIGVPVLSALAAILMLPLALKNRETRLLAFLALLAAGAWFFLSQYHRYGLPSFALLALIGGGAVAAAVVRLPRGLATASSITALALLFAGGAALTLAMGAPDPFPTRVVLGEESRDAFRDRSTPDYYPLLFLEEQTKGTGDRAAVLGYPYNYFVTNEMFDVIVPETLSPFRRIALSDAPPAQTAGELLAQRFRWLVVDYNPVNGESPWPPEFLTRGVLSPEFLQNYTDVAFQKYNVFVYRIRGP